MGHVLELFAEVLAALTPGSPNFAKALRNTVLFMAALALIVLAVTLVVSGGYLNFLDSRRW